jgi:uncharacterized delta-60 repeat protein
VTYRKVIAAALALLVLAPAIAEARRGRAELDGSFGTNGVRIEPGFGQQWIALDGDGRVLAAAGSPERFKVTRYTGRGSPDTSFGVDGTAEIQLPNGWGENVTAIHVQPDGKVLIAGSYYSEIGEGYYRRFGVLARLDADGGIDASFGGHGEFRERPGLITTTSIDAILIQRGKIVVAGGSGNGRGYVGRLNLDGSHDRSFSRASWISLPPRESGRSRITVVAGVSGLVAARGGYFYATGWVNGKLLVARLRGDGRLASRFGERGIVRTRVDGYRPCHCYRASGAVRDRRGRLLVVGTINATAGWSTKVAPRKVVVARYWPSGRLDRGFGSDGLVYATAAPSTFGNGVAVQPDGRILVAGSAAKGRTGSSDGPAHFVVFRFLPDGRPDGSFFRDGVFGARFGAFSGKATQALIQRDGRAVIGGWGIFQPPYSDLRGLIARFRFKR